MKCPKCGYENREGAGFCGGCGQSFIVERACPQCGYANPQGNKFCDKCGRSLVGLELEIPPPSPMPASFAGGAQLGGGYYHLKREYPLLFADIDRNEYKEVTAVQARKHRLFHCTCAYRERPCA